MANEKLIDANKYPCRSCGKTYCHQNCKEFIDWLENTVDAVEVVHSKWVLAEDGRLICDHCKRVKIAYEQLCYLRSTGCWNFCPNCGADMRGDEDV